MLADRGRRVDRHRLARFRGGNEARSDYEKAISLLKQGIDDNSQEEDERIPKWQADLASLHHDFGIFHAEKGDSQRSLEHYLEGLRLRGGAQPA